MAQLFPQWPLDDFHLSIHDPLYTDFFTHIDVNGNDSPPVLLSRFSEDKKAVIAPEFIVPEAGFKQYLKELKTVDSKN